MASMESPNRIVPVGTHVVTRAEIPPDAGTAASLRRRWGRTQGPGRQHAALPHPLRRRRRSVVAEIGVFRSQGSATRGPEGSRGRRPRRPARARHLPLRRSARGPTGSTTSESDTDRRGIYLPPAELHWSLYGVPEQLENAETEECYWELQKFLCWR